MMIRKVNRTRRSSKETLGLPGQLSREKRRVSALSLSNFECRRSCASPTIFNYDFRLPDARSINDRSSIERVLAHKRQLLRRKKFSLQNNLNRSSSSCQPRGSPKYERKLTATVVSSRNNRKQSKVEGVEYGSRQFYHRRKSYSVFKDRNTSNGNRRDSRTYYKKLLQASKLQEKTTVNDEYSGIKRASVFLFKRLFPNSKSVKSEANASNCTKTELLQELKVNTLQTLDTASANSFNSDCSTPRLTELVNYTVASQPSNFEISLPTVDQIMQMEHRHKIRPVQLFVPSSNNPSVLRLNKSALNAVLGHASLANKKVMIISVAGAYRKGKSFLLNFFLEYLYILQYAQKNDVEMDWLQDETELEGFRYRSGAKRDTVGIWMWAEPIMVDAFNGERYAVILLDTQGCFEQNSFSTSATNNNSETTTTTASDNNNNYTNTITNLSGSNSTNYAALTLSTMLSCVQIYNFAEFIPEEAINALRFFTEYGKLAADEAPQFGKPFQKLMVLIRDFKASEEFPYGFEGGASLLEKALRQAAAAQNGLTESESVSNLRQIRQHIRQCFNDGVSCCLLPHPGPKIADANSNSRAHVKDIKPLFRDEIRRFVESLVGPNLIKPKIINGTPITVRKFIECVREYARLYESPDVPTPRSVLNTNIQLSCIDYALEAKIAYCRGMDRVTRSSRMMAEKKLLEAHIKHGIKALNIYDRCPKIDSGEIRSRSLARLQESINHELERYKRLNEEKRVTTCASAMLACGDSSLFGLGLGGAASGAVAASVVTLQMGIVSAGIVAIPVSLGALFGIWAYVTLKPSVRLCLGLERDS